MWWWWWRWRRDGWIEFGAFFVLDLCLCDVLWLVMLLLVKTGENIFYIVSVIICFSLKFNFEEIFFSFSFLVGGF